LAHTDPYVQLWTVRLACDDGRVSDNLAAALIELAALEPNMEARAQLACSARRLPAKTCLAIVRKLAERRQDAADPMLPLLLWWAVEAHASSAREQVLALWREPEFWRFPIVETHLTNRLMRRYAQAGSRRDLLSCATLLELAPTPDDCKRLLRGFEAAFEGRPIPPLPEELAAALSNAGGASLALQVRRGEAQATAQAMKTARDEKAPAARRVTMIRLLAEARAEGALDTLLALVQESKQADVLAAALSALGGYRDPRIAAVIDRYTDLPESARPVAATLLASRRDWAVRLAEAVAAGKIKPSQVEETAVRKLLLHDDDRLRQLVHRHWGRLEGETSAEMRARIEKLAGVLAVGSGNPYEGKRLFEANCGKCHRLFEEGGDIGPDLTAYKRDDLGRMLLNIVNPSAEIREGYENTLVVTEDGRTLTGFVADSDNRVLVLRTAEGPTVTVPRSEIESTRRLARSVMPAGLLRPLTDQQVRDLFAYLRSTQPLP